MIASAHCQKSDIYSLCSGASLSSLGASLLSFPLSHSGFFGPVCRFLFRGCAIWLDQKTNCIDCMKWNNAKIVGMNRFVMCVSPLCAWICRSVFPNPSHYASLCRAAKNKSNKASGKLFMSAAASII